MWPVIALFKNIGGDARKVPILQITEIVFNCESVWITPRSGWASERP